MVVARAVEIIQALIVGLGLVDLVHISTNRIVAGVELDIVLLFGPQRIPFAAIEAKKSGKDGYDTKTIFKGGVATGQNLDQLNAIGLFGFRSVFGMITNGNKWMLTSTTDFTGGSHLEDWDVGKALRSEKISDSISPEQNILSLFAAGPEHPLVPIKGTESAVEEEPNARDAGERVLYASQVVELQRDGDSDVAWESVVQLIAKLSDLLASHLRVMPKALADQGIVSVLDLTSQTLLLSEKF
jgi:hypothetical protein